MLGTIRILYALSIRKVGMTSSQYVPYSQGYTRVTMVGTKGSQSVRWSQSHKTGPSSDCSLQLDCMKLESLVIPDQHAGVNTFPGLVQTARHAMEVGSAVSQSPNPSGKELSMVRSMTGAKS